MKKIILVLAAVMAMTCGDVYAQKKNVARAKAKLNAEVPDYKGAREAIDPALTDSVTKNLADTWFTAGKIYYKLFDEEQRKAWMNQGADENLMATSLMKCLDCMVIADSLDQMPNAKGKVRPKFRKQIVEIVDIMRPGFINAGGFYFKNQNYEDAIKAFEYYLVYPELKFWEDEKRQAFATDSMIPTIQYYCGACASQSNNSKVALEYFKILDQTYKAENRPIQEQEEMFQFMIYEYGRLKDSVALMEMYKEGVQRFSFNTFYARSLVNEYLSKNDLDAALGWIETAINQGDSTAIFFNLKAQILEHKGELKEAEKFYLKAIEKDPEFADAMGSLGRIYYNEAVEELDRVNNIKDNRKYQIAKAKMESFFLKPLPYMEKAHAVNPLERDYIVALRGIYYNLQGIYHGAKKTALSKEYEAKYKEMDAKMKSL